MSPQNEGKLFVADGKLFVTNGIFLLLLGFPCGELLVISRSRTMTNSMERRRWRRADRAEHI